MGRNQPSRKRRRSKRRRKAGLRSRAGTSNPRTRIPPDGLRKLNVMRNFSLYPHQWVESGSSWLDKLIRYGSVAMKIFTTLLLSDHSVGATWQIVGTVEAILIGPEDLAWSSPLREEGTVSYSHRPGLGVSLTTAPTIDYRQGKINTLTVKVTPGSELSRRAGRVSVAIAPLTLDVAQTCATDEKKIVTPTFEQLLLMPGAVTAPFGPVISQTWRPHQSDLGQQFTTLGQANKPDKDKPDYIVGGVPVLAVYVGYQDMAASTADPSALYAPEEALFNVDISGSLHLKQWGTSWIRARPHWSDASTIGASVGNVQLSIPSDHFVLKEGSLFLPWDKMSSRLRELATLQSSLSHPLSFLALDDEEEDDDFVMLDNLRLTSPSHY